MLSIVAKVIILFYAIFSVGLITVGIQEIIRVKLKPHELGANKANGILSIVSGVAVLITLPIVVLLFKFTSRLLGV